MRKNRVETNRTVFRFAFVLVALTGAAFGQLARPELAPGYHQHDGFYLSLNFGANLYGVMEDRTVQVPYDTVNISGRGLRMDFKLGGVVYENTILSADMIFGSIENPKITVNGNNNETANLFGSDFLFGPGLTHYFDSNLFISGTVGVGSYAIYDKSPDTVLTTDKTGPGFQFKVGKEWWVGKNWALGASLDFLATNVRSFKTRSIGVLFNTTFN